MDDSESLSSREKNMALWKPDPSFYPSKVVDSKDGTPSQLVLRGQDATCTGPSHKIFNIEMEEVQVKLSDEIATAAWTFNGTARDQCSKLVWVTRSP